MLRSLSARVYFQLPKQIISRTAVMEYTLSEGTKGDKEPLQREDPVTDPAKFGVHPLPPESIASTQTGDKVTDMQSTSMEEKHRTQQSKPY
ncbi:uncharacterized protein LOC129596194 [Paramacrobiotus metropolitanus]|uniref:uncharacterized protein LOC129596194 n=1 Tax=Paramacrobiotus metropolitanus TaxID=2943436 RepID=UPI002445BA83|nr:uncharacterized protein LOC129596194 [Paramacrobiotus metropolitanus]